MGTSVLHIKTEVECRVYLFDEEKGIAKPGTYFNLEVRKGEQDLLFVSTEDEAIICIKSYNVEEGDCDYRMTLNQSQFINVNSKATDKELADGIQDVDGVVYSRDGLQLLLCRNRIHWDCELEDLELWDYHVHEGCKVIRGEAFQKCNSFSDVTLPVGLTHIGNSAFCNCESLTAVMLPAGLMHIGDSAFAWCKSLTAVTLPNSLTYIGNGAFRSTGIRNVISYSPNFIFNDGCLIDQQNHKLLAFLSDQVQVTLPVGLTHIGNSAFWNCESLNAITLPIGLTHIEDNAFSRCRSLTAITLPDSLTHIGNATFYLCRSLTSVTLPAGLTNIGDGAFGCTRIRNVINNSPNYIFNDGCLIDQQNHKLLAFLSDHKQVILPADLTHIGNSAFRECESLTAITLPAGLTHIGNSAFSECESLTAITLPAGLTHIGDSAFSGCKNLIAITIPTSLTQIGDGTFAGCESLTTIILPAGLTHIGDSAFSGCKNLIAITLPASLTYIGDFAFAWCKSLTTISLSASLTHIGDYAFTLCKSLTTITLPSDLTYIGDESFAGCESLTVINLPARLTHIGDRTFGLSSSLSLIFVPVGMRSHFEELLPYELHAKLTETHKNGNVEPLIFLFFDTETTGVPRNYNAPASNTRNWPRLVQLGWILTDEEGNVLSQGNEIVKPEGFVIPADAARVHGITTEKAMQVGMPLREVIALFLRDAVKAKCIVGHNISFDQKVVGAELYRLGIPDTISTAKSLCTMQAGTDYCKIPGYYGYKWPKLQELHHKLFGCDFEDAHDAMADITATKKCFFEMRKRGLI